MCEEKTEDRKDGSHAKQMGKFPGEIGFPQNVDVHKTLRRKLVLVIGLGGPPKQRSHSCGVEKSSIPGSEFSDVKLVNHRDSFSVDNVPDG